MMKCIKVVIIDGHTLTRYGLHSLVSEHPDIEIVGEVGVALTAPAMVAATGPDVVILDITLPDGDGLRLARDLRDRYAELGIVLLTSNGEDDVLFRALETGVSAFVSKAAPNEELLAAIRHAAVAAASFTATGLAMAVVRRGGSSGRLALSPREAEVLGLLGEGLSVPAIARTMFVSQSTAKTYVARLYEKLGACNRAQAIMAAIRLGLIDQKLPTPLDRPGAADPRLIDQKLPTPA
jgi:DNA-binding NarL/FixJ family response regulator